MHKMNFSQSKKFGDRLEKTIALDFIRSRHKNCTIKSPDDTNVFRDEDNLAIPDHMVYQNGKLVAMYESKNKKSIYNTYDSDGDFFSIDEKVKDYQKIAEKHNVSCYAIFYNQERFPDTLFTVSIQKQPGFYRSVDNAWGNHWYGYYITQCETHQLKPKHTENITAADLKQLNKMFKGPVDDMFEFAQELLEKCTSARSHKPMKPEKIVYFKNQLAKCKTNRSIYELIFNLFSSGEGMGLGNQGYKNRINWS